MFLELFPDSSGQEFSLFGRRSCFFRCKNAGLLERDACFQECTSGALFAAPGPKRPPRRFPGSPQRCKKTLIFSWEAPDLEKVEDSSSETRVQKIPEQRDPISTAPFFKQFSFFLVAGRCFLDPPGGSLRRPWRLFWVRRGEKGDFFAPRGAP